MQCSMIDLPYSVYKIILKSAEMKQQAQDIYLISFCLRAKELDMKPL